MFLKLAILPIFFVTSIQYFVTSLRAKLPIVKSSITFFSQEGIDALRSSSSSLPLERQTNFRSAGNAIFCFSVQHLKGSALRHSHSVVSYCVISCRIVSHLFINYETAGRHSICGFRLFG
jgi:hypothetical protein